MRTFTLLMVALVFNAITTYAQSQPDTDYVPGKLMIRFDHTVQLKGGATPRQLAENALTQYGLTQMTPVWKPEYSDKAVRTKAKRKTNGLDELYMERLRNTFEVSYVADVDAKWLSAKMRAIPGIAYVEPVFIHELHDRVDPNDERYGMVGHDYFEIQRFPQAWAVNRSSESVIIAIIDSGTDYLHPDLMNKIWINKNEISAELIPLIDTNEDGVIVGREIIAYMQANNIDPDGNGVYDLSDVIHPNSPFTNGQDSDGNGFVDDLIGWDYWDDGEWPNIRSDNNPMGTASNHGTHVAGTAAAHTNNTRGIVGTGWNATIMALKAGGAPTAPRSIGFGYQSMLYAGLNGAHIINNSWGGNSSSAFGSEVTAFVNALGVVIVSSAGNDSRGSAGFPAAFPEVLSVGSTTVTGELSWFSNFDRLVDIYATGSSILSTDLGIGFTTLSGTSMASPVVAGLAALLRNEFPDWSPERIRSQIRATGRSIDNVNAPALQGRLGRGMINAHAALTNIQPGLNVINFELTNADGNRPAVGDPITARIRVRNDGGRFTQAMNAQIFPIPQGLNFNETTFEIPGLDEEEEIELTLQFSIQLTGLRRFVFEQFPNLRIIVNGSEANYEDQFTLPLSQLVYENIGNSATTFSISTDGSFGYRDPFFSDEGTGFRPQLDTDFSPNILFSGGLMLVEGNSSRLVSDNVITTNTLRRGFSVLSPIGRQANVNNADFFATGRFNTQPTVGFPRVTVEVETYSFEDSDIKNAIGTRYLITNSSTRALESFYTGVFHDWDIGAYQENSTGYSNRGNFLYTTGIIGGDRVVYVTVATAGIDVASALAIDNNYDGPPTSTRFGIRFQSGSTINNGFTDEEKILSVRAGTSFTNIQSKDVSSVIATGPFDIDQGAVISTGFIYAWAESLEELENTILAFRERNVFPVTRPSVITSLEDDFEAGIPNRTQLNAAYPNPFNPSTQISFDLSKAGNVNLTVYNILGQRVATLLSNQAYSAGRHLVTFDAKALSSGTYITVFEANGVRQTMKMTLVK